MGQQSYGAQHLVGLVVVLLLFCVSYNGGGRFASRQGPWEIYLQSGVAAAISF